MTEIRKATEADTLDILRMAERAYVDGGNVDTVGAYDPARMEAIVDHLLKDEDGEIYLAKEEDQALGMVALGMSTVALSSTYSMAQVITWWVDPERRKSGLGSRLLDAATDWAKERGAPHVWVSATKTSRETAELCVDKGFRLLESIYVKGV